MDQFERGSIFVGFKEIKESLYHRRTVATVISKSKCIRTINGPLFLLTLCLMVLICMAEFPLKDNCRSIPLLCGSFHIYNQFN